MTFPRPSAAVTGLLALLRLLPRVSRLKAVLGALGILFASVLPVAVGIATGALIGAIPDAVRGGADSPQRRTMLVLLAVVGVLVMLERIISPLLRTLAETLGRQIDRYLQERVMAAVGRPATIAHLEDSEVLARLRVVRGLGMSDSDRPGLAVEALAAVLPSWLRALGAAAVLLAFHPALGLLWLVVWPIVVYVMQREYLRVGQVGFGQSDALRRAEYLRDLAITAPAAKEIRIWGMLDWLLGRYRSTWRAAIEPIWRQRRPRRGAVFGTTGTIVAVNALSYGLLVWAAIRGDLGLAALAVYTQALAMANSYTAFDDHNAILSFAAITVPKVLDLDDRLTPAPAADPDPVRTVPAEFPAREIRASGVRFRYPGATEEAVRDLDLTIDVGRSLAIVGENGAGKTSLVKLLCGLYRPTAGTISADGHDLADLAPAAWRSRVSVLFQDFTRYHLSAADNIGMGAPELAADRARLRAAAERAGALPLIEGLPQGWDTILSPEYSGGVDLSGGQWQRIAMARAFFAVEAGARVLILDEPTAALDVRAEAELYERFLELTAGLTTILVSHRFSTVRRADRIIVLDRGTVVEDGTHSDLLALDGRYATMFRLQAARFVDDPAPGRPDERSAALSTAGPKMSDTGAGSGHA
ncbi:ATP-binding cassette domain-containing protein [Solwaraspora sp. WMMD1047]|uniref:ABC transporter ATP-binding protein n=1 Tax=Solwaraspora sp. WMMD1047 TaxID=3016102 RepID=UPI0024176F0D|nr:ATP-binding cassette domain-containing protein [Solwaraspora sp. WMMD1047]MDG4830672.1 ATP-binding cassette domain-containing protein [Solwaraspora sp. WMMD1047]